MTFPEIHHFHIVIHIFINNPKDQYPHLFLHLAASNYPFIVYLQHLFGIHKIGIVPILCKSFPLIIFIVSLLFPLSFPGSFPESIHPLSNRIHRHLLKLFPFSGKHLLIGILQKPLIQQGNHTNVLCRTDHPSGCL